MVKSAQLSSQAVEWVVLSATIATKGLFLPPIGHNGHQLNDWRHRSLLVAQSLHSLDKTESFGILVHMQIESREGKLRMIGINRCLVILAAGCLLVAATARSDQWDATAGYYSPADGHGCDSQESAYLDHVHGAHPAAVRRLPQLRRHP